MQQTSSRHRTPRQIQHATPRQPRYPMREVAADLPDGRARALVLRLRARVERRRGRRLPRNVPGSG